MSDSALMLTYSLIWHRDLSFAKSSIYKIIFTMRIWCVLCKHHRHLIVSTFKILELGNGVTMVLIKKFEIFFKKFVDGKFSLLVDDK